MVTSSNAAVTATKTAAERRLFTVDFTNHMSTGETIEAASPAPAATATDLCGGTSDITIESPLTINGQTIEMWINGGTAITRHLISVIITTSTGQILEGKVILEVK